MLSHAHCNIFNSQIMEITYVSISRSRDKDVCMSSGILAHHQKEWNLVIFNIMDGTWQYSAKRNEPDIWFHLYVESKQQIKQINRTKLRDKENRLFFARGELERGMDEMGDGNQEV